MRVKKLNTKVTLWISLVFAVVIFNSALGILLLKELRSTDVELKRNYAVALRTRRLRESLFEYNNFGLTAALTHRQDDVRKRDESRLNLLKELRIGFPDDLREDLRAEFSEIKVQIERLMAYRPFTSGTFVRDPSYRKSYSALF